MKKVPVLLLRPNENYTLNAQEADFKYNFEQNVTNNKKVPVLEKAKESIVNNNIIKKFKK